MKKKINKMMILIATVTILLTMVLITVVYYDLFRRQVLEDLKSYGLLLSNCSSVEEIEQSGVPVESDLRLTIIGSDGRVLYDNEADSVAMGNHSSRPEIREAMQDGEGEAVRNYPGPLFIMPSGLQMAVSYVCPKMPGVFTAFSARRCL